MSEKYVSEPSITRHSPEQVETSADRHMYLQYVQSEPSLFAANAAAQQTVDLLFPHVDLVDEKKGRNGWGDGTPKMLNGLHDKVKSAEI